MCFKNLYRFGVTFHKLQCTHRSRPGTVKDTTYSSIYLSCNQRIIVAIRIYCLQLQQETSSNKECVALLFPLWDRHLLQSESSELCLSPCKYQGQFRPVFGGTGLVCASSAFRPNTSPRAARKHWEPEPYAYHKPDHCSRAAMGLKSCSVREILAWIQPVIAIADYVLTFSSIGHVRSMLGGREPR